MILSKIIALYDYYIHFNHINTFHQTQVIF